jgi:hypothetical protein
MSMKVLIYKKHPRLVFYSLGKIYKFFDSKIECAAEIKSILSSPMKNHYDLNTSYTMSMVNITFIGDSYYIMEKADGRKLNISDNDQYFQLAGRCLNIFHSLSFNKKKKETFLYGDFISDHLFIDTTNKRITLIDPGSGFCKKGIIETDIARFIIYLVSKNYFNLFLIKKKIHHFVKGYDIHKIDYQTLKISIDNRLKKNYKKNLIHNLFYINRLKGILINSITWLMIILIKKELKKIFNEK